MVAVGAIGRTQQLAYYSSTGPAVELVAPGGDLRTDVPRYRVYRHGELAEEPATLSDWWRDDLVGFVIGRYEARGGDAVS